MLYRLYACSTHEAIDTVDMHVLAKAYRAAWRSMWATDPIGPHLLHALDLVIDFGMPIRDEARSALDTDRRAGTHAAPDAPRAKLSPRVAAAAALARRARGTGQPPALLDVLLEVGADEPVLIAACFCDPIHPVDAPPGEIAANFGAQVGALLAELTDAVNGAGALEGSQPATCELDRLALAGPEVQTLRLAQDLASLREPGWLREAVRDGRLAQVAARASRLKRAHPLLLRRVRAALALWEVIPWALPPDSRTE